MAKYPREILETYIVDENGLVFQLVPHKVEGYCYIRRGNNYKGIVKKEVQQNIVHDKWRFPNEHELSRFIKEDNEIILEINHMILKRVLFTQLLIELDDELKPHFADDNRAKNLLEKSQDHLNRKNAQLFRQIFKQDEELAQNMMKSIDKFMTTLSGKKPNEIYRISELILKAEEDPSIYDEKITMTKIE